MRFKLLNVLVKACLMGDMATRKLQNALTAKSVLERLLADSALAAYEGPLTASPGPLDVEHASHASAGARGRGGQAEGRIGAV